MFVYTGSLTGLPGVAWDKTLNTSHSPQYNDHTHTN